MAYYKATRRDGTDFFSGTIDYGAALKSGEPARHPLASIPIEDRDRWSKSTYRRYLYGASRYLSVSASTGDCVGMTLPCRLFEVYPKDPQPINWSKYACLELTVVRELPSWFVFGEASGEYVVSCLDSITSLTQKANLLLSKEPITTDMVRVLAGVHSLAIELGMGTAWTLIKGGCFDMDSRRSLYDPSAALQYTMTASALMMRDEITKYEYDLLSGPWRRAVWRLHPDDQDIRTT